MSKPVLTMALVRKWHPWAKRGRRVVYRGASGTYRGTLTGQTGGYNSLGEPCLWLRLDSGDRVMLSVVVLAPEGTDVD